MVYKVYSEHIQTKRISYVDGFDTKEEAVAKIRQCYAVDARSLCENEYYYFIK